MKELDRIRELADVVNEDDTVNTVYELYGINDNLYQDTVDDNFVEHPTENLVATFDS